MSIHTFRLPKPPPVGNLVKNEEMLRTTRLPFWWGGVPETTKPVLAPMTVTDKLIRFNQKKFGKSTRGRFPPTYIYGLIALWPVGLTMLDIKRKLVESKPKKTKCKSQKKYHWPQVPDFVIKSVNKFQAFFFTQKLDYATHAKK